MKTKVILVGLVTVSLVMSVFLSGGIVGAAGEVTIGVLYAYTGDLDVYGESETNAMKMAVKEINDNGGVLGKRLKLVIKDTETSDEVAIKRAYELAGLLNVPVIIGTTGSGPCMAVIDYTTSNGVLQISPSVTAAEFTDFPDNDLFFRTCPSDALQGIAMARLAIQQGYKTASTLVVWNTYGIGFEEAFTKKFEKLGGKVLASERYDPATTSFDSEVEKVAAVNPEFVMLCADPDTGSGILQAAYNKGYMENMDWLLSEGLMSDDLADMVGTDETGNYIVAGLKGTTPDPRVVGPAYETFKQNYTALYGIEPTGYCANAYDVVALVAFAIEHAGDATGTAIRDAIRGVANPPGEEVTTVSDALALIREGKDINYQGASSEITFDENGDVPGNYCEWSIADDGRIVLGMPMDISAIKTIRIGYQPSTHQIAYMTAVEKGWWERDLKKFGIVKITEHEFPSGPPEMIAMHAGELDVAYVGTAPPITAIDKGLDAKIVAAVQINGSALVLLPEHVANYTSPTDLKGLKIATFPPGSIQDTILKKWLKDHGLDPDHYLEIIGMWPGEAVTAIVAGAVNGVFLPAPLPTIIEQKGTGKIVAYSGEMWPNHACCCLLVSGELISDHPELVGQIVRTHINATEYNTEHVDEAAEIYAKKVPGSVVEIVKKSLENWDGAWISDPHLEINSTLEYVKVDYEMGYIDKLLTEDDLFDTSFYDKIMGFFDTDSPANPYPSIFGTHNGTITPKQTITVQKLYTYPCTGTGGHTEYAKICNDSWCVETLPWAGYNGDLHNISFNESFPLYANVEYNYTIITGSYPQVHHTKERLTANGWINCTEFVDANGKKYGDWIPAIKLE